MSIMRPETDVIHRGEGARRGATPLDHADLRDDARSCSPARLSWRRTSEGKADKYIYSRYANPTVQAVEEKLAVLEGADAALRHVVRHGRDGDGAVRPAEAGDEVVCSAAIYGGTLQLIDGFLCAVRRDVAVRVAGGTARARSR